MDVYCSACGQTTHFDQPHSYHAGFANQGFLYNDAGNLTLVWSSFDKAWESIAGAVHPWMVNAATWARLESALHPAPHGGRWRAANPPRCSRCRSPIGQSIADGEIHYLIYPGGLLVDDGPNARTLSSVLTSVFGQPNER